MSSRNFKLDEKTIAIIASKTDNIREYDIKRIAKFNSIPEDAYIYIMDQYMDPSSSSKEAKIEALLKYLTSLKEPLTLLSFLEALLNENSAFLDAKDMQEINLQLIPSGLKYDVPSKKLLPITKMPERSFTEEKSQLEQKLKELSFLKSLKEFQDGLDAISKGDKVGIVTRIRRFLEELHEEIIIGLKQAPHIKPVVNREYVEKLLKYYNPRGKTRSNLRLIIDGLYGMLSELGSHPPITASMDELVFLIHLTVEIALTLLKMYEKETA